jgi:fluoride exporter
VSSLAWLAFLIAAAIGAPARYLVDGLVQDRTNGAFPWGTFVVNLSGSLLLGIITGWGLYHGLDPTARIVLGTGGMGAYTTFSTLTYETVQLAEQGAVNEALRNALGSFLAGLAAASAGLAIVAAI